MVESPMWVTNKFCFSIQTYYKYLLLTMLGSKDLGFYVFRTLICIVGKP